MSALSPGTYLVWRLAASETERTMHAAIEQEFVLIGLCLLGQWLRLRGHEEPTLQQEGVLQAAHRDAASVETTLHTCGLHPDRLSEALRTAVGKGTVRRGEEVIHRSAACRSMFQHAEQLAHSRGTETVHSLHVLAAIFDQPGALITRVVTDMGVDIALCRTCVQAALTSFHSNQSPFDVGRSMASTRPIQRPLVPQETTTPYLDRYGSDLTQQARAGKLDPIIGRKEELLEVVRVLHQKTKNMAILVSEPGVSRIAVIKGLALRIASGDVVPTMRRKRLVELPVYDLTRGPMAQSQGPHALHQMLEEARQQPDMILFIDNIHTLLGSATDSPFDLVTLLKPALDQGALACIGSTTVEQFQASMATDPFCMRYCQPVVVPEPSLGEMQAILEQVRPRYEAHHMVTITPGALETVVVLAAQHMPDRRFPEKALDLLDQACARARISQITLLEVRDAMHTNYEVTQDTIAAVVAQKTGIPLRRLLESPHHRLQRLAKELQEQVLKGPNGERLLS